MEVNVDRNLYRNDSKTYTDENGVEQYGVFEMAYRDPQTHRIIFEGEEQAEAAPVAEPAEDSAVERVTVSVPDEYAPGEAGNTESE